MEIVLGRKYRDLITGYEGVATGEVKYISGCNQVLLAADAKDGDCKSNWFDLQRVRLLADDQIVLENERTPGFDSPAPKR